MKDTKITYPLKVINLWGGPGSGKSTTAAGLFHLMKKEHYDVELITEYAKDMVWERQHPDHFTNQIFISAMQNNKQLNLVAHNVEYCITDSPILMSALYRPKKYYKHFLPLLKEINDSYDNINFFLERDFNYVQKGRNKNEKEAIKLSKRIRKFMDKHGIEYQVIRTDYNTAEMIFARLRAKNAYT